MSSSSCAQISVEVSNRYSAIQYATSRILERGETEGTNLLPTTYGDSYVAKLVVKGSPVRLIVVDLRDVISKNGQPNFLLDREVSGSAVINLPKIPSQKGMGLVLTNRAELPTSLDLTLLREGTRPDSVVNPVKRFVEIPIEALGHYYNLPKLTVRVAPCGLANAYSSPDVVICTELIGEVFEKGMSEALYPILLHELAHSLLNLWGLPAYDNEDVADEFAAIFLAQANMGSAVDQLIRWLEEKDSATEAIIQMTYGDRHTISIQRARNLKAALAKSDALAQRWGRILAPYAKK
jgi:hypothetical protein